MSEGSVGDGQGSSRLERRALLALEWDDSRALVRVRDNGAERTELLDPIGLQLNYQIGPEPPRWCVGHHAGGAYVDCPRLVEERGRTCSRCQAVEAIFASQLHHAHTQPKRTADSAMGQHLQQQNILYLAAFRDGSIKVGTSTATRNEKRLREQGAWMARKVAVAADGYAVRELEDLVTAELGVVQAVQAGRKVAGLIDPLPDTKLADMLADLGDRVASLIDASDDERIVATATPWANPAVENPIWQQARRYPLRLQSGSHDLEIAAVVGRSVALRRPYGDDVFAVDLGSLFGIEFTVGAFESDEIVIQDSLF